MSRDAWEGIPDPEPTDKPGKGAPKGTPHASPSKDTKEKSYLHRKAEGKALYVRGFSLKTISKEIDVPSSVINNWAEDEGWRIERDQYQDETFKDKMEMLEVGYERAVINLEEMKKTAMDAIEGGLVPKKYAEAVSMYIAALEMQRKMKVEAIEIKFLTEVAKILKEEIEDSDLLRRIAMRMSYLYKEEQVRNISGGTPPPPQIPEETGQEQEEGERDAEE